jgi:hypothetical protein
MLISVYRKYDSRSPDAYMEFVKVSLVKVAMWVKLGIVFGDSRYC